MTKPADRLHKIAMSPHTTMDEAAMLKNCGRLLDEAERALERAQDHLYNPFEPANQCAAYYDVTAALAKLRGEQ
jgi:hypothetical protein